MNRSSAEVAHEKLAYSPGMDCHAVATGAPHLARATGHADVEAVDPTDVGIVYLDVAVVEVAVSVEGGMGDHRSSSF
jgi:hypothetical protein